MPIKIITVGDKTDHGGTVISGSPTHDIRGRAIARLGDQVNCPQSCPGGKPHGVNKITTAYNSFTVNGVPVAVAMKVEYEQAVAKAKKGKGKMPLRPEDLAIDGINVVMGSLWPCAQPKPKPDEYEEIYIHAKVAIVDDAAFTIGSANLNLRSMAIDSELNILSQAKDVAYRLRCDLFTQCAGAPGPGQFADMRKTFNDWQKRMTANAQAMKSNEPLLGQIVAFQVDRKPGAPLI